MCLFDNILVFEAKCDPKHRRILSIYEAGAVNKIFVCVCVLLCEAFFTFHIFFLIHFLRIKNVVLH